MQNHVSELKKYSYKQIIVTILTVCSHAFPEDIPHRYDPLYP